MLPLVGGQGGLKPTRKLGVQLTLLQPGGQIMPTTLLLAHPDLKTQRQLWLAPQDLKSKLWLCNDMHVISVSITTNIMIAIGIPLWHGWLNELITVNHTTSSDLRSLVTLIFSVACYQAKSQYKSLTILPLLFRVILGTVFRLITSHFQQWF